MECLCCSFKKILENAGYEHEDVYNAINAATGGDYWFGWDLKAETFTNMKDAGIIDPAKVTRCALENAASVASVILLTEACIVDKPENEKNNNSFDPTMGMM